MIKSVLFVTLLILTIPILSTGSSEHGTLSNSLMVFH